MRVIVPAVLFLSVSLALLVGGCASAPAKETAEQVTLFEKDAPDVTIPESLGSPRVRSWRAVDDRTLIIEASGHGELVATFTTPCRGIRFAETLGFATLGPFELDRSTQVILPDGTRCHFKELKPLVKLEEPAGEGE